jgi:hypothetical protein
VKKHRSDSLFGRVDITLSPAFRVNGDFKFYLDVELPQKHREVRSFQASVMRVGKIRDEVIFSIGSHHDFTATGRIQWQMPAQPPGLYKISSLRLAPDNDADAAAQVEILTYPLHFRLYDGADTGSDPEDDAKAAYAEREVLVRTPHYAAGSALLKRPNKYLGFVICSGALVHLRQDILGLSLIPYGHGLSYNELLKTTNEFAAQLGFQVNDDPAIARDYALQTPLTAIVYHEVRSPSANEAVDYIVAHSNDIITILGIERGFRPTPFAVFVWDGTDYSGHYLYDRYHGNLIAPFSPGQIGEWIERYLPKLHAPRSRLLLETYAQATTEKDRGFAFLRYWALLELIAADLVTSDNITIVDARQRPIMDASGKTIKTKRSSAKVYKYIFDAGFGAASIGYEEAGQPKMIQIEAQAPAPPNVGAEVLTLWEIVQALYEIRNQVAHSGAFVPDHNAANARVRLASRFFRHQTDLLFSTLKSHAWMAVLREVQ